MAADPPPSIAQNYKTATHDLTSLLTLSYLFGLIQFPSFFLYTNTDLRKDTMTFPPPPVNTIDWSDIGFKVREGKSTRQSPRHFPPHFTNSFPKSMAISSHTTASRQENGLLQSSSPILSFAFMAWHRPSTMASRHTKA